MATGDLSASLKVLLENDARAITQPISDLRPDYLAISGIFHMRDEMPTSDVGWSLAWRFYT